MVSDTVQHVAQLAHDVGLAAWLGGAMFGKFAQNPSLRLISSPAERGQVANAAWNGDNLVNAAGLGSAAAAYAVRASPSWDRTRSRSGSGHWPPAWRS